MIISDEIAVVPVGISCITGHQIAQSKAVLEKRFGVEFKATSSFFRYVFQDPRGIALFFEKYLINNEDIQESDLTFDDNDIYHCPHLRDTGTWFVHEEPGRSFDETGEKRSLQEIVVQAASKYNYLLNKFRALKEKKKRIFVLSNADLAPRSWPRYLIGCIEWKIHKSNIDQTFQAINKAFPEGENIFLFVGSIHNVIKDLDICVSYFVKEANDWCGNDDDWQDIFSTMPLVTFDKEKNARHNNEKIKSLPSLDKTYTANSPEMCVDSGAVKIKNNSFEVSAYSGTNCIWGPYIKLCCGLYEVSLFVNTSQFWGVGQIKITSDNGNNVIISREFNKSDVDHLEGCIKVRFFVQQDVSYFETLIASVKHLVCKIDKIVISRV
ncbi:hypothetical protein GT348_01820 [Aristophania vespae]|uniref:Uncharacterized protein n=1 Tax=Aristophania vespae TaxID=2697033 RepID=A0A6P1NCK9_9PROT|nr:hypothetical protein [Aristophania vespae]QHI95189.1 hypothetical protein GT348_01820 [Aristophania vespae]